MPIFSVRHSFQLTLVLIKLLGQGCCVRIQRLVLVYLHILTFLLEVKFPRTVCQGRKRMLSQRQMLTTAILLGASLKQKESLSVR